MEGKPYAVIETDGHSGDAGTKTRIEAFLHCVREDLALLKRHKPNDLRALEQRKGHIQQILDRKEIILLPRMGPNASSPRPASMGVGGRAESLPRPDREALPSAAATPLAKNACP